MRTQRNVRFSVLLATALTVMCVVTGPPWIGASAVMLLGVLCGCFCVAAGSRSCGDELGSGPVTTALLRSLSSIFIYLDAQGKVLIWNSQAAEILGLSENEARGRHLEELDLGWDRERIRAELDRAQRHGSKIRIEQLSLQRDRTTTRELGLTLHPVILSDGRADGVVLLGSDITEKVRIEQELRQKQAQLVHASKLAALGEMSTGLAHEISQPLNVIKIGSDHLLNELRRDKPLPPETVREVLEEISRQVQRVSGFVRHLLAFSRPAGRTGEQEQQALPPVDANSMVVRALELVRNLVLPHGIHIGTELGQDLPPVLADPLKLEQVLVNLVLNARDAINERRNRPGPQQRDPGHITVATTRDRDQVRITVTDNGCGIPQDMLPLIFDPFFTTKEVGQGTGLGLSISYSIVREFGGTIDVTSQPDVGTTFTVCLPHVESNPCEDPVSGPILTEGSVCTRC